MNGAKSTTTVSIDAEVLKKVREHAKREKRSLSAQVEKWIEEKLFEATARPKDGALT